MTTTIRDPKLRTLIEQRIGTAQRAGRQQALALRLSLLLGAALAVVIAVAVSAVLPSAYAAAEPDLIVLLRGMALLKAALVTVGLAALWWRFGWPLAPALAAGYVIGACLMIAATVMIWQLTAIGVASVLFHGAGLSVLILALRDGRNGTFDAGAK